MSQLNNGVFSFGPFRVEVRTSRLYNEGHRIKVARKPFHLLVFLLENRGHIVPKAALTHEIWGADTTKDDTDLAALVRMVRKVLGDNASDPQYIGTVPSQGYSFIFVNVTYAEHDEPAGEGGGPISVVTPDSNSGKVLGVLITATLATIPLLGLAWLFLLPWCVIRLPTPLATAYVLMAALGSSYVILTISPSAKRTKLLGWIAGFLLAFCVYYSWPFAIRPMPWYSMRPGQAWKNTSFPSQSTLFLVEFETVPQRDQLDSVFALSNGPGTNYPDFACLARLSVGGKIEAFDGERDAYRALSQLTYRNRQRYRFRFAVDPQNHKYSVYVRDDRGEEYTIAKDFEFRRSQRAVRSFANFGTRMDFTTADNWLSAVSVCELHVYSF